MISQGPLSHSLGRPMPPFPPRTGPVHAAARPRCRVCALPTATVCLMALTLFFFSVPLLLHQSLATMASRIFLPFFIGTAVAQTKDIFRLWPLMLWHLVSIPLSVVVSYLLARMCRCGSRTAACPWPACSRVRVATPPPCLLCPPHLEPTRNRVCRQAALARCHALCRVLLLGQHWRPHARLPAGL